MSFIYSRALAAASLPGNFSDADVFVPSSESPTPKPSSSPGKTMARSPLSRFGMTCEPLTADHGAALLTSWLAAFPARTSALQEAVTASTASDPASGQKWRGSFAKYDPAESKWKTHQCSLLGGLDEFSETWPKWGSMRNGECYPRQTWAPPTFESESGSPVVWPTPTASGFEVKDIPKLIERRARLAAKYGNNGFGLTLNQAVKMWPTPCASASASKGSSPAALTRKSGRSRASDRIDHAVMASDGGQLNPQWVEWLMGWPIGHTALEPLATDRLAEWLQQHGNF
jgi:hypothetical protein